MVRVFTDGVIILIMMENFRMTHSMVMVSIIGVMVNGTKDNGYKGICKEKANSFLMVRHIKVRILNENNRGV